MEVLIVAFLAGVLTILAPCVVSIIPILLARSADGAARRSPLLVIVGLAVSIIVFTVILKATSLLLGVPAFVWQYVSGAIIIAFGIITLFPTLWEWVVLNTRFVFGTQDLMGKAAKKRGAIGDILLGASLGPVFSACSPTYALLVAVVLPAQPALGLLYLLVFVAGLSIMLYLIALFGQRLIRKLGWGINPRGLFRRLLGVLLVVIGVLIISGLDKQLLALLVSSGFYDFQVQLESDLLPSDL